MNGILITFPIAVILHFLRICVIIMGFFFIGIFPERIEWCEEDSLSSSLAFLSIWNASVLQDRLDERTTPVKNMLLPIVRNQNVLQQLRVYCYSTTVSLNCSEVSSGIFGICTVLEARLAASLMNRSKANLCLRNLVLPVLRTLSAVPALSCPNESLRQIVFHLDRNDAPILQPFWRPLSAELLHTMNWQE